VILSVLGLAAEPDPMLLGLAVEPNSIALGLTPYICHHIKIIQKIQKNINLK
jgi:hypothetical protein